MRQKKIIKKKNRKGFTMTELLVVIVILGLLSALSITAIQGILQKARNEYYLKQIDNITMAAQSYIQNNKEFEPKVLGQKTVIKLEKLQEAKYMEKVFDYNKKECFADKTYVNVFKYSSEDDYAFNTFLYCPNYSPEESDLTPVAPKVTFTWSNDSDDVQTAKVTIKITAEEKLFSYSYKIYTRANSSDKWKEAKIQENVLAKGELTKNISVNLTDYTPNQIKAEATVVDYKGSTTTNSETKNFADKKKPICGKITGANKTWTTDTIEVSVACSDGNGSGCTRDVFTKQFNTSTKVGKIKIEDKAGNTEECSVDVYIDKTAPTIPTVKTYLWKDNSTKPTSPSGLSSYSNNTWSNKKVFTNATSSTDSHSGGIYYQYKISGVEGEKTANGDTYNFEHEGVSEIQYRACDKLNNCSDWTTKKTIKLDFTAPNIPIVNVYKWKDNNTSPSSTTGLELYTSGTWSNKRTYSVASGSTDSLSGDVYYQVTTTGKTENVTNKTQPTRTVEIDGISQIKFRACDAAGNCSGYSNEIEIKIDKVAPSCGSTSGESTTWTNSSRSISVGCNDETSGCISSTFTNNFTSSAKVGVIQIKDNAGNTNNCSVNAYVDTTPPTQPSSGSIGSIGTQQAGTAGGSSDSHSGVKRYLYCIRQNNATVPSNTDSCFGTNRSYSRSCGTRTYAYVIAEDNVGNRSSVRGMGSVADNANVWNGWSGCSASCGGGTQTRTNQCALVGAQTQSCNTHACLPANSCKLRGTTKYTVSRWKCSCGSYHTQAYVHYCTDSSGTIVKAQYGQQSPTIGGYVNASVNTFPYVCPLRPYGEPQGYTMVND